MLMCTKRLVVLEGLFRGGRSAFLLDQVRRKIRDTVAARANVPGRHARRLD